MTDTTASRSPRRTAPIWFWLVAAAGLAWNIFGAAQFLGSLSATADSLQAQGLTPDQAAVMLGHPIWMTAAFAVGVSGGVFGCLLLLLRNPLSFPVFAASLAGYIILYVGDITEGVFAALGAPQVIILSMVVLIAAALLLVSRHSIRTGIVS